MTSKEAQKVMTKNLKHQLALSFLWVKRCSILKSKLLTLKEEGASIIEFALVAPFFILVVFAAFQVGLVMFVQNALEAAAREASRYGITAQQDASMPREAAIKNKVLSVLNTYTKGIVNPLKVMIAVKSYPNLPSLEANGTPISNTFGIAGQAVRYEISYTWNTLFPIFGTSSTIVLKGITPIVNESY